MDSFAARMIDEVVKSQIGKTASYRLYDRSLPVPMNIVLDEAEKQLDSKFVVCWVDGGIPELFVLPGINPSPVIFSSRYLSLTTFMRRLITNNWPKDILIDLAKQSSLSLMAEYALRHGSTDYAVLAFMKSMIENSISIGLFNGDELMDLEYAPRNETYMSTWFYGLAHELGHLHPSNLKQFLANDLFSDSHILDVIKSALDHIPAYSEDLKSEIIERASQQRTTSAIGIDRIRSEFIADCFAVSVLSQTTLDVMQKEGKEQFNITDFIREMIIFMNILTIINRCQSMAKFTLTQNLDLDREDKLEKYVLSSVISMSRGIMQRLYLEMLTSTYLFGMFPSSDQFRQVETLLDNVVSIYKERINNIDTGLARAMEFTLFPSRHENNWVLLGQFRKELKKSPHCVLETRRFFELANAVGTSGKLIDALKKILDGNENSLYFIPWVEGPNEFSQPFGLDTKYGFLIFAFTDDQDDYDLFFKASDYGFSPGFTLNHAAISVQETEELHLTLTAHMPRNQAFEVIVQGTDIYRQYKIELNDGTIWE